MDLIFDVKHLIASMDKEAWYWMVQLDNEFSAYASSINGICEYKKIHAEIIITENWTEYRLFGKRHREDGPAIITHTKSQLWYYRGLLHRGNGPVENGHGPAIIRADGSQEWLVHGILHREDGPAVIEHDGFQYWYRHGKRYKNT